MRKRSLAREYALKILYQYELNPGSLKETISLFWKQYEGMDRDVQVFAESLVEGTTEQLEKIDKIIVQATQNWQMNRMAVIDRNILRFGTYELLFREDIPPKVTINEAVNLAKKFSQEDSGKFVNGVLDKINHMGSKALLPAENSDGSSKKT